MNNFDYTSQVIVLQTEGPYSVNWMPSKLTEAVQWLQNILNTIPEEHRDTAYIEISSESDYDGHNPSIEISYTRPASPAEIKKRKRAFLQLQQSNLKWAERGVRAAKKVIEGLS